MGNEWQRYDAECGFAAAHPSRDAPAGFDGARK